MVKESIKKLLYPFVAIFAVILIWYAVALVISREYILPSPLSSINTFFLLIGEQAFYKAVGGTLLRSLISFFVAFFSAVIFACAAAVMQPLKRMLSPIIVILRATPTISIILLSLIWLKSDTAPILIAFLIVFPAMYTAILGGIDSTDSLLIEMSKVYKVRKIDTVTKLYIPYVLPTVFTAMKANISLNLKIIIASEVLAGTIVSMGFEMQLSKLYLETPQLLAYTIAAVLLGFFLEIAVEGISKLVIRWKV